VALVILSANVAGAFGAVEYSVINLDTLGGTGSEAHGLNDSGQVVGEYYGTQGIHAYIYSNGNMTDLGALPAPFDKYSDAAGISAAGVVVGTAVSSDLSGIPTTAFLYSGGTMSDLVIFDSPNISNAQAMAINASGKAVGFSTTASGATHAFVGSQGNFVDIGTLGGSFSIAFGINSNGDVVGKSAIAGDVAQHAFLYQNNTIFDIGTLGGNLGEAEAVNDADQITGYSNLADDSTIHAFLYSKGSMSDLGTMPGDDQSLGLGINEKGNVVGFSLSTLTGRERAFIYSNGVMTDLNSLVSPSAGWRLFSATAINNSGQIVGFGEAPDGYIQAFLLNPLPEPNPFTLFVVALAIGISTRRFHRKTKLV
jgi:probable HAF family extracellular repeat protein